MPYDKLLTMFIKFFSRKNFQEQLIEEAKQLEEFLDNVAKIKSDERLNLQELSVEEFRLTAQTQALTGAFNANFNEFIKLAQYFSSSSIISDYKIFARHRYCFQLNFNDMEAIENIVLEEKVYKKELAGMWGALAILLFAIGYFIYIFHDVINWLVVVCAVPKLVSSIIMLLIIFIIIVVCIVVWSDKNYLKFFVKKYTV